jgi:anti-sigma-K factor RskA
MKILDEEARELLAAECALGVMKGRVQRRFRRLADGDSDLREKVARWERQLNVLCEGVPEIEAPAPIWSNIERRLQRAAGLQRKETTPAAEEAPAEPAAEEAVPAAEEDDAGQAASAELAEAAPAADEGSDEADEPRPIPAVQSPSDGEAEPPEDLPEAEGEDASQPPARSGGNVVTEALNVIRGKILERPSAGRRQRAANGEPTQTSPEKAPGLSVVRGGGPVRRIREDLAPRHDGAPLTRPDSLSSPVVAANDAVLLTDVAANRTTSAGSEAESDVEAPPQARERVPERAARPPIVDEAVGDMTGGSEDDDLPPWPPREEGANVGTAESGRSSALDDQESVVPTGRRRRGRRRRTERAHRERTPSTGALRFWQAFAVIAALAAVGLGVYVGLYGPGSSGGSGTDASAPVAPAPEAPTFVVPSLGPAAVLNGSRGEPVWLVHASGDGQIIEVHRLAQVELPLDQSLELWLLRGADTPPMSLGVLARAGGTRITLPEDMAEAVRTGEAFAVSLEPAGGSTTGEISGPIVQSGAIYHVR